MLARLAPPVMLAASALLLVEAATVTPEFTTAPEAGVVIETANGFGSGTETLTGADVVEFPAGSKARAVIVCVPTAAPAVFHAVVYG